MATNLLSHPRLREAKKKMCSPPTEVRDIQRPIQRPVTKVTTVGIFGMDGLVY